MLLAVPNHPHQRLAATYLIGVKMLSIYGSTTGLVIREKRPRVCDPGRDLTSYTTKRAAKSGVFAQRAINKLILT